eukprot:gene7300-7371_t
MIDFAPRLRLICAVAALFGFVGPMRANETAPPPSAKPAVKAPPPAPEPVLIPDVASYCQNLIPVMANAKAAAEMAQLKSLRTEIARRMAELDVKKTEVENLVKKRDAFTQLADEAKIAIYLKMKPDAAAAQLAAMDETVGAAIISKLPPRTASVILAEIKTPMTRFTPKSAARHLTLVLSGCLLAGCVQQLKDINQAPGMSPVGSGMTTETDMGGKVPKPARAHGVSLWDDRSPNLYQDGRAAKPGDIVTVNISINDKATFDNTSTRSREAKASSSWNLKFPLAIAGTTDLASKSSTNGTGTVDRAEKIQLSVAAVVTDVMPNGNLVVAGSQEVRVNFEMRVLTVGGIVRPADVAKDNTIAYDKIAEARISYGGRGRLTEVQQPSSGSDKAEAKKPSFMFGLIGVVIVTLIAAGAGGGSAFYLVKQTKLAKPVEVAAPANQAPGKEAASKEAPAKEGATAAPAAEELVTMPIPVVLTNLADPPGIFVRLEAELILDAKSAKTATALASEISGDYMAYLHTLSIANFEGARFGGQMSMLKRRLIYAAFAGAGLALVFMVSAAQAQQQGPGSLLSNSPVTGRAMELAAVMTILSLAPGLVVMMTSFTRFVIAFSFLRSSIGLQSTPANLVLISLSMFMTLYVMAPTFDKAWVSGIRPLMNAEITEMDAYTRITAPFRTFMLSQVRPKDLQLFEDLSRTGATPPAKAGEEPQVDMRTLVPAFMISELRRGFEIGFLIALPFLVIDMIVATVTMSMGMMMLPPSVISLPIKVLFFVLIDGWNMLVGSLVRSVF